MTTYKEYLTWNYDKLEAEYTRQGFYSLTAFLLAQKNKTNVIKKSNKHKVKVSDIKSGHCVGFTKEGHSIIAGKKQTKGIIKIVSVPLRGLDIRKLDRHLKHKLGAESRSDFGRPFKKPHFRLWV